MNLLDPSNIAFLAFLIFVAGLLVSVILFLRSAIGQKFITKASEHAQTYAVAYVKGGILMGIAMIASFDEAFHPLTKAQAENLAWWDWAILFMKPISAAFAVLVAFLDRSTQRATPTPPAPPTVST